MRLLHIYPFSIFKLIYDVITIIILGRYRICDSLQTVFSTLTFSFCMKTFFIYHLKVKKYLIFKIIKTYIGYFLKCNIFFCINTLNKFFYDKKFTLKYLIDEKFLVSILFFLLIYNSPSNTDLFFCTKLLVHGNKILNGHKSSPVTLDTLPCIYKVVE